MKLFLKIFFCVLIALTIYAQEKTLNLEDVILKGSQFSPKRLTQLQWIPGKDNFVFVKLSDDAELVVGNTEDENLETLLKLSALNLKLEEYSLDKLKAFPRIGWVDANIISFWKDMQLIAFDLNSQKIKIIAELPDDAENIDFQKEEYIAYTVNNNLFIHADGKDIKITNEVNYGIVSGQSVSRNEFGISKGTFWSPENTYLAFYQKDETNVTDYPLVDVSTKPASLKNIKYPMAGMTSENVKVGIYNLKTNTTIWLKVGEEKKQYLTNVTWSPDEKYIYIAHLNRDQNHMRLVKYNPQTGEPELTLFERKMKNMLNQNKVQFL